MGKTEQVGFSGFDAVFENLGHKVIESDVASLGTTEKDKDDDNGVVDLSLGKKQENDTPIDPDDLEAKSIDDIKFNPKVDNDDEPGPSKKSKESDDDDSATDIDSLESENVAGFFDAFAETLGWEIDEDAKPKSVEGLVDYIKNVVEENSTPQYANDDVAAIDEFVRNGGNITDFINSYNSVSDYSNIDLNDEDDQKRVVKDYLKHTGLSDTQINRKISKYEDAGLLEDEAEEALDFMKEIKEKEHKQLLKDQEKQASQQKEEQQKFYKTVVSEIENLKDVRGIPVKKEDVKALQEYLFKVEGDGKTKYQKDYSKSVKNLIESAYFTMKGDALINSARQTGETSAVRKLKQTLTSTKINGSKQSMNDNGSTPVWAIGSFLRKPTN